MYTGFVLPEHRLAIRKLLKDEPFIESFFSKTWVENNLIPGPDQRIESVHPLYKYLIHTKEKDLLLQGLKQLSNIGQRHIIAQLKQDRSEKNVAAIVRNIQTFIIIQQRQIGTHFEPTLTGSTKRPDILTHIDDQPCYLEIFTVFGSESETEEGQVITELHARINLLGDNPFVIGAEIIRPLKSADLEKIWAFLKKTIRKNRKKKGDFEIMASDRTGNGIIKFKFSEPNKREKGFWGYQGTGGRWRHDGNRLKGKILSKLDKLQFPSKDSINGYILYLEDWMMSFRDTESAILGQEIITFRGGSEEAELGRKQNGVIHHSIGREPLLDWVDFYVVAAHPLDLPIADKCKIFRNTDRDKASEHQIRSLLS